MLFNPIYSLNYAPYLGFYLGAPYVFGNAINYNSYVVAEQALNFTVFALKPNTVHYLTIDGVDVTNRAKQVGRLLGMGLMSDASGYISFKYYFGSDLQATTTVEQAAALAGLLSGSKQLTIKSSDNASGLVVPINIPDYARTQIAAQFKKNVDSSGNTSLTIVTTPSTADPDVYYTPASYSYVQTFYADPDNAGGSPEISISSIDLYFRTKPTDSVNSSGSSKPGVSVAICEVENDSPIISKTYVRSVSRVSYDNITTFSDASNPVTFGLSIPLKLATGKSYGIVVMLEDAHYTLWTNVTGANLVGTNTKSPGSNVVKDGNLFARNNSGVFTARTNEDLKFNIKAAKFTSANNTITYVNDNFEFFTMANSVASFLAGEQVYKLKSSNDVGTVSVTTGSSELIGVGTSFTTLASDSSLAVIANSTLSQVFRVSEIANNTHLTLDSPSPFTASGVNYQETVSGSVYYKAINGNKLILAGSNANTIVFQTNDVIVGEDTNARATISTVDVQSVDKLKIKTTIKDSTNGSVSATVALAEDDGSLSFNTTGQSISVNDLVATSITDSNAVIVSRSLEVGSALYSNTDLSVVNKSMKVDLTVTGSPYRAPSIPDLKIDCFTIAHTTNSTTTSGGLDQEIFNNNSIVGRHIEKRITFASERFAEDVRVFMRAYRPLGTDVKVYARVHNSQDAEAFDDKNWTPLEYKTNSGNYSSSNDQKNFLEYELGFAQYPQNDTVLAGTFTTTLNSATINANGVDPSATLTSGDLIKVYSELFPNNYWIGVVSSVNSTTVTLRSVISTSNVVGDGFKIAKLKYKNVAFNNINNDNIVRYYNTSMAEFDSYDSIQIKIVFLSQNSYIVPSVDQIQVIGVSA